MVVSTRRRLKKGKYTKYESLRIWMSDYKLLLLFFLQNAYLYVSLSVLFLIASSLLFHMVFLSEAFAWVPKWTQQQLLVTGVSEWISHLSLLLAYTPSDPFSKYNILWVLELKTMFFLSIFQSLGYVCCIESVIICVLQQCKAKLYHPVGEDPSMTLQDRHQSPDQSPQHKVTINQMTHNFRSIGNTQLISSTTVKQLTLEIDDVQPCSSKSLEPYRMAW